MRKYFHNKAFVLACCQTLLRFYCENKPKKNFRKWLQIYAVFAYDFSVVHRKLYHYLNHTKMFIIIIC